MKPSSSARRAPILPQNSLDRLKVRLSGAVNKSGAVNGDNTSGPFLRRVVGSGSVPLGRAFFAIGALWLGAALVAGDHGWLRQRALARESAELHHEVDRLDYQLRTLREQTGSAADPYVVERVARETFGLAHGHEVVYQFENDAPIDAAAPLTSGVGGGEGRISSDPLDITITRR